MKAVGAFSVKSYNQPRREQRQQVIAGARELGMMVVPEGGALFQHNMTMIVDGHTGIEHTLPVGTVYSDVLQLWAPSGTYSTPTLGVAYGGLGGENYWYQHTNVWENDRLMSFVPRWVVDPRRGGGRWRPSRSTTTSARPASARSSSTPAERSSSVPTASSRAWRPTGSCGCSRKGA
jgi:hypothetical protein